LNLENAVFLRREIYLNNDGVVLLPQPGRLLQRAFTKYVGEIYNRPRAAAHVEAVCEGLLHYYVNTPVVTRLIERICYLAARDCSSLKYRSKQLVRRAAMRDRFHWDLLPNTPLDAEGLRQFRERYHLTVDLERELLDFVDNITDFKCELSHPWFFTIMRQTC
jgi:hypothetical protein